MKLILVIMLSHCALYSMERHEIVVNKHETCFTKYPEKKELESEKYYHNKYEGIGANGVSYHIEKLTHHYLSFALNGSGIPLINGYALIDADTLKPFKCKPHSIVFLKSLTKSIVSIAFTSLEKYQNSNEEIWEFRYVNCAQIIVGYNKLKEKISLPYQLYLAHSNQHYVKQKAYLFDINQ